MKVLVTGGAGFIGSHIVDLLLKQGFEVIVADNLSSGSKEFLPSQIKIYEVDILSKEMEQVILQEQPNIIIHQAAQVDVTKSLADPIHDFKTNALGTVQLLHAAQKAGVQKFIFSSSCAVYGDTKDNPIKETFPVQPLSFYGLSKSLSERYTQLFNDLYDVKFTILRYANVYGPRQNSTGEGGVVSVFANKILANESITVFGDGEQTRDFVFVKDVATANLLAIHNADNEIINIGCQSSVSINQLIETMSKVLNKEITPNYAQERIGDIKHSSLLINKANNILKWNPKYSLEDGLIETIEYYR
ncbi:UDP-glucose 4-epimerase [Cytobacillus eiseniae]|uniref:UDP-glucose 4-epimerase n=1 Tax=Cytobacillus eiseniae TaxID=762947 RepID=A0ABS4REN1_9BACI|nr:NAD-dependent epimerase/dehydratase family protein [Cytobacillus eiseniae]MBP2240287.1 UDP-glucose 4-epimerase [Cytobacillus eiseniae]